MKTVTVTVRCSYVILAKNKVMCYKAALGCSPLIIHGAAPANVLSTLTCRNSTDVRVYVFGWA